MENAILIFFFFLHFLNSTVINFISTKDFSFRALMFVK